MDQQQSTITFGSKNTSLLRHKHLAVFRGITIEPVIFLLAFGFSISQVQYSQ